ncbi:unnamed protein product, partial [Linum tenue]
LTCLVFHYVVCVGDLAFLSCYLHLCFSQEQNQHLYGKPWCLDCCNLCVLDTLNLALKALLRTKQIICTPMKRVIGEDR